MPSNPLTLAPPQRFVDWAVYCASSSPCRSKRGAVVFRVNLRIASGHNDKPAGFACDGSAACKATCRVEAVHAEQRALLMAGLHAHGADLLHVKAVDGQLVPSGGPSCVQCSKLALSAGIAGVWLFHADGWRRYDATEFHRLSLSALASQERPEAGERTDGEMRLAIEFAFGFCRNAHGGFQNGNHIGFCQPCWNSLSALIWARLGKNECAEPSSPSQDQGDGQ